MLNIQEIQPMANYILTTADKYTEEDFQSGLIETSNSLKEVQRVLAIGPMNGGIQVGDLIMINPMRYAVKKHESGSLKDGVIDDNVVLNYRFKMFEIDGKPCLYITTNDVEFIIKKYEEVKSKIIMPSQKILA